MKRTILTVAAFTFSILTGCAKNSLNQKYGTSFHTTPDKWTESRNFHTRTENYLDQRLRLSKMPHNGQVDEDVVVSPNKAYWFSMQDISPTDETKGALLIDIFSERPHLSRIELSEPYLNFQPEIRWINEKLLYIEIWWGRVVGSYLIFDVEKEEIVVTEAIQDGRIAFQQWQEAANTQQDSRTEPRVRGPVD